MNAILLSNPSAGGSGGAGFALEIARRRLAERLGSWSEVVVRPGEEVSERAQMALRKADLLLVAGGDGTVRAAAAALHHSDVPLGILPTGTVNVLARELGIPLTDPAAAVDIALGESERCCDVGFCNDRPFLLVCSGGVDSATVAQVNLDLKNTMGATAYALAALGALTNFTPPTVSVTIDGKKLPPTDVFLVAIGNTSLYGGDLRLLPDARIDDGLLDIVLFVAPPLPASVRNAAFLPQLADAALGRHAASDSVLFFQGRHITLESAQPVPLQMDGDLAGTLPATIRIDPKSLRIRCRDRGC